MNDKLSPDIEDSIDRYIAHIRQMALLSEDQIRIMLRQYALENPEMFEVLKEGYQKKNLNKMKKLFIKKVA